MFQTLCLVEYLLGEHSNGIKKSVQVWQQERYQIGTDITAEVEIPIPAPVRTKGEPLSGWLVASYVESEDDTELKCDYSSGECDAVYSTLTKRDLNTKLKKSKFLQQQRVVVPIELTRMQQDLHRSETYLLGSSEKESSPAADSEIRSSHPDTLYPHFKYIRYPLTVRIVHYGKDNLASTGIPELGYQFVTHKDKASTARDTYYEPITFVDDVTLLKRQCVRISSNTSAPHPKITMKIISTSVSYFAVRVLEQHMFNQIEQQGLLGDLEMEDMKRTLSDEYLYRYALTFVISWVHIYLEYAAFRQDLSFFVVR